MKPTLQIGLAAVLGTALLAAACQPMQPAPPPPAPPMAAPMPPAPPMGATLYQRLGGQPAIQAVVKDFVENQVAPDPRINRFFAAAVQQGRIPALEASVVNQVCQATGGPCVYQGPPMQVVHHGMQISNADFDAFVQDLIKTLNKFNVPQREQQELLGILGPLRAQIVNV